jgi:hypothetical protein
VQVGDTFLIPKRGDEFEHLWIVLTEPDDDGNAVCVNVTRKELYSDTTTVLKPGEHPFISKESVVHYPDAQILNLHKVQKAIDSNPHSYTCKAHKPCSDDLFTRIQEGLLDSPHTPKGIKKHCLNAWGQD